MHVRFRLAGCHLHALGRRAPFKGLAPSPKAGAQGRLRSGRRGVFAGARETRVANVHEGSSKGRPRLSAMRCRCGQERRRAGKAIRRPMFYALGHGTALEFFKTVARRWSRASAMGCRQHGARCACLGRAPAAISPRLSARYSSREGTGSCCSHRGCWCSRLGERQYCCGRCCWCIRRGC